MFNKISGIGNFYGSEREGVSPFSVKTFLSHSAKTFVRESFSVSLFSGLKKMLGIKEGGGELRSSVTNFSSQCRKITERPFCVSECCGY